MCVQLRCFILVRLDVVLHWQPYTDDGTDTCVQLPLVKVFYGQSLILGVRKVDLLGDFPFQTVCNLLGCLGIPLCR